MQLETLASFCADNILKTSGMNSFVFISKFQAHIFTRSFATLYEYFTYVNI